MIQLTKTETVYLNNMDQLSDYLNALVASDQIRSDVKTSIQMNNMARELTTVFNMPAVVTYVAVDIPQIVSK